jgi:hypothetical protein
MIDLPLDWSVLNVVFVVVVEEATSSASRVFGVIVKESTTTTAD